MLSNRKIQSFKTQTIVHVPGYGQFKASIVLSELPTPASLTYTPEGVLGTLTPRGRPTTHFMVPLANVVSVVFDGACEFEESKSSPAAKLKSA